MNLFHYTGTIFDIGDVLEPQTDGYCNWPENQAMESILEFHRPQQCISRQDSVFLVGEPCDGELYGAESSNYELSVNIEDNHIEQRSDIQWLAQLDQGYSTTNEIREDISDDEIERLAKGYWSGKPFNDSPKFEYRTRKAIVESIRKIR